MVQFDLVIFIMLIHFLADFALQTNEQSQRKSESLLLLFYHVGAYSAIWFIAIWTYANDPLKALYFTAVTFICHFITDWVTGSISRPFWLKDDKHNGYVIIGFDQLLHYIQLFLTYNWISIMQ